MRLPIIIYFYPQVKQKSHLRAWEASYIISDFWFPILDLGLAPFCCNSNICILVIVSARPGATYPVHAVIS